MSLGHVEVACGYSECGAVVWMDQHDYERRLRTQESWYCPKGHKRHFSAGQSAEERRIADLERQVAGAERDKAWLRRARDYAQRACPWSGCDYEGASERGRHLHLIREHGMPPLYLVRAERDEAAS